MATDVTVAPTNGAAVLFTNGGTGASPGFNAIDIRRMIRASSAFQEGVFGSGDWKVTEKNGGTNMSVDVAANLDLAVVKNDALLTPRDLYIVAPHSATINLGTISGNSSGNPRLDYIVLQVRNQDHDGSGQYDARVRYLTGTANASASHSNPAGAPTIPDSAVLLAQVLVPTGTTSAITNSMIRDRRPWAQGLHARILRVAAADSTDDYDSIASGAWTIIDSTNAFPRVELSGAPLQCRLTMSAYSSSASALSSAVIVDSTSVLSPTDSGIGRHMVAQENTTSASHDANLGGCIEAVLAAGSHRIGPGIFVTAGSGSVRAQANAPLMLTLQEIPAVSATNGTV